VLELVSEMSTTESITIVRVGETQNKDDPSYYLNLCLRVLNDIPRTRVRNGEDVKDTYKLAAMLTEYLGKYKPFRDV